MGTFLKNGCKDQESKQTKTGYNRQILKYSMHNKNLLHKTQKPVALGVKAISNHKADIVLDVFLGSGSTLIACEKTNRKCYGMELDPHYCDVIIKRWEDYTGKVAKLHG